MNNEHKLALATLAVITSTMLPSQELSAANLSIAAGGDGGAQTYTTTSGSFVKESFVFNLSSSVGIASSENSSIIGVGTIHSDGQFAFTGSSEGGSVDTCGTKKAPADDKDLPTISLTTAGGCGTSGGGSTGGSTSGG